MFAHQRMGPFRIPALGGYYWPCRGIGITGNSAADEVDAVVGQLAAAVAVEGLGPFLRMGPVLDDDVPTSLYIGALRRLGWRVLSRKRGVVLRLSLPATDVEFSKRASSSMLKNLGYLKRRLVKQHGVVDSVRFELAPDNVASLVERLARIEASSWVAGEGGEPKFAGSANSAFWSAVVGPEDGAWKPVVWILQVDGRDVAFSAHLETPHTIWIFANSYDASWKAHSPGSLLTLAVLQHAISNRVHIVDWGQGDSGYKGRWGAEAAASLQDHLLFSPGWQGVALHALARRGLTGWVSK